MSTEYEKLIRACDACAEHYQPLLKDLIFYLSVGIIRDEDKFSLAVLCYFDDLDSVTEETKKKMLEILGSNFIFEDETYPLDIAFMGIPLME